jgi:hypothetical protein
MKIEKPPKYKEVSGDPDWTTKVLVCIEFTRARCENETLRYLLI